MVRPLSRLENLLAGVAITTFLSAGILMLGGAYSKKCWDYVPPLVIPCAVSGIALTAVGCYNSRKFQ